MAFVVVYGGLEDAEVGGVDVVLVKGHRHQEGTACLVGTAPKERRVDILHDGKGGVGMRFHKGLGPVHGLNLMTRSPPAGEGRQQQQTQQKTGQR
ncbi:MAG: hypothetical protein K2M31_06170 [Muribaculaceae bacterium]|nr:hypothetical protein [Muribaculaceae bacterium]